MVRPRVKICCIASPVEAELALRYGASALGLVSAMPSGPGVIDEARILEIAERIPPSIGSFLLTSLQTTDALVAQQRRCRTNTLQLVDAVSPTVHREIRAALPGISIVQVIHVTGPAALDEALEIAPRVHGLLLDSGNPTLAVKELGGTGRVHDWVVSAEICERAGVPVFLAGGLTPSNVVEAIRQVRPFGLDLCSGLRSDGHLDEAKLGSFMERVAAAS